jgi:hypothetical protein
MRPHVRDQIPTLRTASYVSALTYQLLARVLTLPEARVGLSVVGTGGIGTSGLSTEIEATACGRTMVATRLTNDSCADKRISAADRVSCDG